MSFTKVSSLLLLSFLLFISSCDLFNGGNNEDERIIINNNQNDLQQRIEYKNDDVPLDGITDSTFGKITTSDGESFVLVLRAEVSAPVYDGFELRASHVTIDDGFAYVSYNREGEDYLGGVEVFDVSDIQQPLLVSQAIFTDTDISSVYHMDGQLYLAEAVDPYIHDDLNSPAVLEKMTLSSGLLTANTQQLDLSSYVATDVDAGDNLIYVTTGSDGHIYFVDPEDFTIDTSYALTDARSVAGNDNYVAVLSASPAALNIYDQGNAEFINSYSVGGTTIPESKSVVEIDNNLAYITLNDGGLKVLDLSNGSIVDQIARPETAPGGSDIDYVTNGVSINDELILIANGAAGVYVGSKYTDGPMEIYGSMEFQSSTNFVEGKDDVVFVATGFGGFRILEVQRYEPSEADFLTLGTWDNSGLPDYLESPVDTLNDSTRYAVRDALPESVESPVANPEYFDNAPTNAELSQEADLYVTFIMEGAGWKNTLGFYTFDPNDPPESPEDLEDMTVIFPNVSAEGSGGSLIPGHTVHLGRFPAGTAVGFFLVAQGWNGDVSNGYYTHYSNYEFNRESDSQLLQHNVLLNDITRNQLILAFEDVTRSSSSCDNDFNDAVFSVSSYPENAFVIDNIPIITAPEEE